jgi:predicted nucleic acid-binding protein
LIAKDASAVVELLLPTPAAGMVNRRLFASGETQRAPHLLDVEGAQLLRRYARAGTSFPQRAVDLADLPLNRYPHDVLLPPIWQLRHNITAYAAAYLALAEASGATLVTRDRAGGGSSQGREWR